MPTAARPDLRETVIGCPIRASLGALGHKWGFMVLRDVAFCKDVRFSDLLRNIDGLTPRILTTRLRELQRDGLIRKAVRGDDTVYELTPEGLDTLPILAALTRFGVRHRPKDVFRDGRSRTLEDIVPDEPTEVLGAAAVYAVHGRLIRVAPKGREERRRVRGRPAVVAA